MSNRIGTCLVLAFAVVGSGCAFGPIYSHESARTVGDNKNEFTLGVGNAGYGLKYSHGVNDNFDIGVQFELMSLGLRAKYAFVNNPSKGLSFAGAAGLGYSDGGTHYYGDLILSHIDGWFEPYAVARYVHIKTDPINANSDKPDGINFHIDSFQYNYGEIILGSRFWTAPRWELTAEVATFVSATGARIDDGLIVSLGFGHRW